jgi:golgi phosphoprotein 3
MDKTDNITGLTFLEKVVLLALDDKGWFGSSEQSIKFGLAGAILFELFKHNRIELKEGVVVVKDTSPLNDPFLDKVLEFIRSGKKNRSIRIWIQRMVYKKMMIRKSIIKALIAKKILRKEEYSIFWVMYQFKYPIINPELKRQLREDIFYRIMKDEKLNGFDLMMISVMDSCKMIRKNFKHLDNYPRFRRRIKDILLFNNPDVEDAKLVAAIDSSIRRAITASNVSIHA